MAQMFYLAEPQALAHHVYVGGTHEGSGALHLLRMDASTGELRGAGSTPAATLEGGGKCTSNPAVAISGSILTGCVCFFQGLGSR